MMYYFSRKILRSDGPNTGHCQYLPTSIKNGVFYDFFRCLFMVDECIGYKDQLNFLGFFSRGKKFNTGPPTNLDTSSLPPG